MIAESPDPGRLALALLSGALSTLSPCVLPLLPIVIASALEAHRWGAIALGLGLVGSFTAIGLLFATAGLALGLDQESLRQVAGWLLLGFGLVLLLPSAQRRFAALASRVSAGRQVARLSGDGLAGQFLVGLALGAVWSPCAGPTLGTAATLAGSGDGLGEAALVMLVFGLGAALPLVVIGVLSRPALNRLRGRLLAAANGGKRLLGALLLAIGLGIVSGYDHRFEGWLSDHLPAWLADLTTRY